MALEVLNDADEVVSASKACCVSSENELAFAVSVSELKVQFIEETVMKSVMFESIVVDLGDLMIVASDVK